MPFSPAIKPISADSMAKPSPEFRFTPRKALQRRSREQGKAERRIQRIKRQKAVYVNITQQVVIFPAEPKL